MSDRAAETIERIGRERGKPLTLAEAALIRQSVRLDDTIARVQRERGWGDE